MKSLTLKAIAIFILFWAIWNFAWVVSFFSLMNNTPQHYTEALPQALVIWFLGALISSLLIAAIVNPVEKKYARLETLSNEELLRVSKSALNIHFISMLIYIVIWVLATTIMYFILKANYGNIAASSFWVGGIAGLLACPFMVFGVMPIVFSKTNRNLSAERNRRQINAKGIYLNVKTKLTVVLTGSILGVVIWIGGFAYYTGINQMIEEVKVSRQNFQVIIAENILSQSGKEQASEAELLAELKKIKVPSNELLLLLNKRGEIISDEVGSTFQKKQSINTYIEELLELNGDNSIYDNTNQNVISSNHLNSGYTLLTVVNVSSNTERMGIFFVWFVLFMVVGMTVALSNSIFLSGWLGSTINNLLELFEKLAKNDFSNNATKDSEDELGTIAHKYNEFIISIRKLIQAIQTAAQTLLSATEEISSNNQALTQRTAKQASSVEELSSILEQISSSIIQNTDNAKQTEEIALQSVNGITLSDKSVAETIAAMKNITEKAQRIIEIARQTDILAINAAIEAARAGQLGKGFAVVASEIRRLAENTKEASNQIDQLTTSGIQIANHSGNLLKNTVEEMTKTGELVKQVTNTSIEQSSGVEQLNNSSEELNRISQENASTAEETAASSEELSAQANELFGMVSNFRI